MVTQARSTKAVVNNTNRIATAPLNGGPGLGKSTTVVLKNVTVEVSTPSSAQLKKRLAASKRVATEFSKVVLQKGVNLRLPDSTPSYVADPKDSTFVIRKLGKTQTRGRFSSDGRFVEVKEQ